ncbi:DUF2235 domain-containing protein [Pantoea agglomerans]|jgi:hypothetical protein|uniref:DUF2235 domain-containing protein n=1 Tax=Enterobacter agglomerans TaxID=549 RepID=UPI00165448F1|nr:DUF2235 domain-containing protein [Pantoea agglomerans]UOV17058.1 DUF2235 domain-containing protein [Pantoea agglomerans]
MFFANHYLRIATVLVALIGLVSCNTFFSQSKTVPTKPLDGEVVEKASALAMQVPLITAPEPGKRIHIYKIAFDGTMNDRLRIPLDERETLVARIARTTGAIYYPGAGMQGRDISNYDAATGTSSMEIASCAAREFYDQAEKWYNQDSHSEIRVFVTGFSRGAATAREFMNQIDSGWGKKFPQDETLKPHFYAILYDTVATGQKDKLDLSIPTSLDYLVHFVAEDETRNLLFTPTIEYTKPTYSPSHVPTSEILPQRINVIKLPGAHSDVGGAYADGIGDLYIVLTENFLYMMGLIQNNHWQSDHDPLLRGKHDSRGLLDKLFGAKDPSVVSHVDRPTDLALVRSQSEIQQRENQSRLRKMWDANIDRGAFLDIRKVKTIYASFIISKDGNELEVKSDSSWVDPVSVFIESNDGQKFLRFKFFDVKNSSKLKLSEILLSQIRDGKHVLSYSTLNKSEGSFLAIWLDNRLIELVPGKVVK